MCEGCTAAKPEGCTTAAADCNTDYCGYLANGGQRCLPWCNTYTCASHPIDCGTCAGENGAPNCVEPSKHCESWSVRTSLPSYLPRLPRLLPEPPPASRHPTHP